VLLRVSRATPTARKRGTRDESGVFIGCGEAKTTIDTR
jgi:hypothetical protein